LISVLSLLRWTFTVEEAKYLVTFAVMFLTAVVISYLGTLIKRQAEAARLQERQTAAMHALSGELAATRGMEKILQVAVKHISEIFQCQAVALLPDEKAKLHVAAGDLSSVFHQDIIKEFGVAQGAYQAGRMAGWGTQTMPDSPILYGTLKAADATWGPGPAPEPQSECWLLPETAPPPLESGPACSGGLRSGAPAKRAPGSSGGGGTERLRSSCWAP
jgi:two-component system sensor histidine kinase KdpD